MDALRLISGALKIVGIPAFAAVFGVSLWVPQWAPSEPDAAAGRTYQWSSRTKGGPWYLTRQEYELYHGVLTAGLAVVGVTWPLIIILGRIESRRKENAEDAKMRANLMRERPTDLR